MTRAIRYLAVAMVLTLGVVSCGDDVSVTDPDPQASAIVSVSGDGQVLEAEEESGALTVRVNDQFGDPFQGATVTFSGEGVDHSLSATSATTGSNGEASVNVTAGDEAGSITVTATVAQVGTVTFILTVEAEEPDPEPSALVLVGGDGQTLDTSEESAPLVVRVNDQFGSAFAGAEVTFTGDGVSHSLSATTAQTGANGEASVLVTAGEEEGSITVAASVEGLDPVTFTLTVEAATADPEPATLEVVSGDGQTLDLNTESAGLVVRVEDQFGAPFPGASVSFTGDGVDHTLSDDEATTDAEGEASITATSGDEEGTITVTAAVAGLDPVTFTLTVEDASNGDPDDPEASALVVVSGDGQILDLNETSASLVVRVNDQFGNAFAGATVQFTSDGVDHSLSSATGTSGANGQVSTTVTAGEVEGAITVTAQVAGVGSVTFNLEVEEHVASDLVRVEGDGQTIPLEGTSAALVVRVDDQFGSAFAGAEVTFSGDGVDHQLSSTSETTGANGQASITVTAEQTAGTVTVTATVPGLDPVDFTLEIEERAADDLIRVSGDDQTLGFNATSDGLVVRVDDQFGDPLEGTEVTFSGDGAAHQLSSTSENTGADGQATVTVDSEEEEGTITITATVTGLDPVTFTLTVEDDSPDPEATTLVKVEGDGQTIEPNETSAALVVRVDDQFTNPFQGAEVTFAVESGDGTLTSTSETTGANGQASTTVTAGATESTLTISATVAGLTPVTFTITVEEAPTSFFTDFEEYATGAFPGDWTDRGLLAGATSITVEESGGSNVLRIDLPEQNPSLHRGISWDEPGNHDDVRVEATVIPGTGAVPAYITARGTADDTYYRLQIRNNNLLELVKVVDGTSEVPIAASGSDATFLYQATETVHLVFEVEGSQLRGKAWIGGDTEPATWTVEVTDTDISAAGWTGVGRLHEGVTDFLTFEVTPLN